MPARTLFSMMFAFALAAVSLAGCEQYSCEGACAQYYLSTDGNCGRPSILSDGTSAEDAQRNCAEECTTALYTTTESPGGSDDRNYQVLENQSDAEAFINCIAEQDYSEAAFNSTCADLDYTCPWFRW